MFYTYVILFVCIKDDDEWMAGIDLSTVGDSGPSARGGITEDTGVVLVSQRSAIVEDLDRVFGDDSQFVDTFYRSPESPVRAGEFENGGIVFDSDGAYLCKFVLY